MKKIYLAIVILFAGTVSSNAQFVPGQKVLGGNLGLSTGKREFATNTPDKTGYTNFLVGASIGKFRKANVLQGLSFSYSHNRDKITYSSGPFINKQYSNAIGLSFFRQHFFTLAPKLYFTLNGSLDGNYNFGKQTSDNRGVISQIKSTGFGAGFGITPGLSYQLSKRVLFDATFTNVLSVTYSQSKSTSSNGKDKSTNFNLSSSLSNTSLGGLGLGFRLLLKK